MDLLVTLLAIFIGAYVLAFAWFLAVSFVAFIICGVLAIFIDSTDVHYD